VELPPIFRRSRRVVRPGRRGVLRDRRGRQRTVGVSAQRNGRRRLRRPDVGPVGRGGNRVRRAGPGATAFVCDVGNRRHPRRPVLHRGYPHIPGRRDAVLRRVRWVPRTRRERPQRRLLRVLLRRPVDERRLRREQRATGDRRRSLRSRRRRGRHLRRVLGRPRRRRDSRGRIRRRRRVHDDRYRDWHGERTRDGDRGGTGTAIRVGRGDRGRRGPRRPDGNGSVRWTRRSERRGVQPGVGPAIRMGRERHGPRRRKPAGR